HQGIAIGQRLWKEPSSIEEKYGDRWVHVSDDLQERRGFDSKRRRDRDAMLADGALRRRNDLRRRRVREVVVECGGLVDDGADGEHTKLDLQEIILYRPRDLLRKGE